MTVHGKHRKRKRDAHKSARSPETARWERDDPIPARPAWMDAETYQRLARLRYEL